MSWKEERKEKKTEYGGAVSIWQALIIRKTYREAWEPNLTERKLHVPVALIVLECNCDDDGGGSDGKKKCFMFYVFFPLFRAHEDLT